MARTVAAGSGSSFGETVWWTVSVWTGKKAGGLGTRSDSSAPHAARL